LFGLFKKPAPAGSFIIVALKSALILRATERQNGGLYTELEVLRATTDAMAKQMNAQVTGSLRDITYGCVMELLMEQNFLDRLITRSINGGLQELSKSDENELKQITRKITGIA
jgi:hypothetical protein